MKETSNSTKVSQEIKDFINHTPFRLPFEESDPQIDHELRHDIWMDILWFDTEQQTEIYRGLLLSVNTVLKG